MTALNIDDMQPVLFSILISTSDSEKTLALLDHVIGYYHVAEEVEPVIRDG